MPGVETAWEDPKNTQSLGMAKLFIAFVMTRHGGSNKTEGFEHLTDFGCWHKPCRTSV